MCERCASPIKSVKNPVTAENFDSCDFLFAHGRAWRSLLKMGTPLEKSLGEICALNVASRLRACRLVLEGAIGGHNMRLTVRSKILM